VGFFCGRGDLLEGQGPVIVGEGEGETAMAYSFDPELADETGLVAIGGDLEPATLVRAYRAGVFPWFGEEDPILWWSPDPRAIFDLHGLHVSRRLARTIRSGRFRITIDHAFRDVLHACSDRPGGTWLTAEMIDAYCRLHRLGVAHSVEAWLGDFLASKVALAFLFDHLRARGYQLFDTQVVTRHTENLGAFEIPRKEYLARLKRALDVSISFA
jgi:leucyl/phenylalanyl-tRNA--protein transferase